MRPLIQEPFADIFAFVGAYLAATAALSLVDWLVVVPEVDLPWMGYWVMSSVYFAPSVMTAVVARLVTAPESRRLRALYAGSLVLSLGALQITLLIDPHPTPTVIIVAIVCLSVIVVFKTWHA
jgi:hypothetical protein